ncbi:MAG: hypothetical protein J5621_06955 [Paludibacteraceae bacterium]|nr:hypothetical protein [Paludibacteraceae bacterium]
MKKELIRPIAFCLLSIVLYPVATYAQTDSVATAADTIVAKPSAEAKTPTIPQVPLYQGMTIKLDVGATILALATSNAKIQNYEISMNWRLKNRFYPTLELGYAAGSMEETNSIDRIAYSGQGGFFRVGFDINPLKKHPESLHALLVGLRFGTSVQDYTQIMVREEVNVSQLCDPNLFDISIIEMGKELSMRKTKGKHADCWGEIVAGCQVNIVAGLYMGWMARFRFIFTEKSSHITDPVPEYQWTDQPRIEYTEPLHFPYPIYIPGYGKRDNIAFGFSYHIGYHF